MGTASDRNRGLVLLLASAATFAYYTLWTLVMPFVDVGHPMHDLFPSREYAILVPVVLMCLGLTIVFSFLALVMIKAPSGVAAVNPATTVKPLHRRRKID